MRTLSAKSRITIGLASLLVSVLCVAMMIGLVPEEKSAILASRAKTCEAVALASSDYISHGEIQRLRYFLKSLVDHNEDVLSAGVRNTEGQLVVSVGNHEQTWQTLTDERSRESQVQVPIRSGSDKWGSVELRFAAITPPGQAAFWQRPWTRLALFVTSACYLAFFFYLGKMLQHLDPSKSVPKRVRSALDSLAEGLLVIDRDQRIVLANQSFCTWVGRTPERLLGLKASKLGWVKNEQGEPIESYPWVDALRLEAPQAGAMLGLHSSDDTIRTLMANASPVLGHDGKYRGVLVSFDDVTQLEQTKQDLHVAKQMADQANQAKSEFLARMSHEIRTPMNAILGYTDVLRRGFDTTSENRQDYLNTIHASGEHLLALINDILDLSKVESGQMQLELQRCSPHQLITDAVALLKSKSDEKGIYLEFECRTLLPETILTDSVRLRQAIVNLAGNAIKFTERGGVKVSARLEPAPHGDAAPGSQLVIDVIDTGIGIPQAAQDRIFQPFAQADTSVTRRFGGTGLGLAISKQLAEAMGGGITLTSEEGRGSTFTVTIDPGPLDGIALIDQEQGLAARRTEEVKEIVALPDAYVLVADDGESNRKLIELVLRRAGVHVTSVENGQQAMDRALQGQFDVVLMDMQMPVMDGYTATTKLRDAGYTRPIIALTAHAMHGDELKCRNAGCSGFLTKPISIDKLLATLADVLGPADGAGQPAAPSVPQSSPELPGEDEQPRARITCSLPLDDPDFLEIAEDFCERMVDQLEALQRAASTEDAEEIARLAHWIKGSGGTAGFDDFTEPAYRLEQAACARDKDLCHTLIQDLAEMCQHIELDQGPSTPRETREELPSVAELAQPLRSSLPTEDADFREVVEEFLVRLREKFRAMEDCCERRDYQAVAFLAHWLKGCGGTAGFEAFTDPAFALEQAARQEDEHRMQQALSAVRQLVHRALASEVTHAES